jgi:hypothetical protein
LIAKLKNNRVRLFGQELMVNYIDVKFGRIKLKSLLKFTDKSELLSSQCVTEKKLVKGWRNYIGLI